MSKYEPLGRFLDRRREDRLTLDFDEVEQIVGFSLPRSAVSHQAWWANNPEGHSHCRAWIDAGWRTENLNITGRHVDFVRVRAPSQASARAGERFRSGADPWGALAGTVTVNDQDSLYTPSGAHWDAQGETA